MRRYLWLIPILWCASAFGSVAFDATANCAASCVNAGTSIPNFNITIGSGSNRAVGVGCSFNAKVTGITVTVGGASASAVAGTNSTAAGGTAFMVAGFVLANPSTGVQAVAISWTNAATATCGAVSVSGADQATPGNNGTFAVATSGVPTVAITSNSGDLTFAFLALESGAAATGVTQTAQWNIRQNFAIGTAGDTGPGTAGPITHAYATTGSEWEYGGFNFKQAAGATGGGAVGGKGGNGGKSGVGL